MTSRRRVLFIGEAVSLAHAARPLVLAGALDPGRYEIHFACDPRYGSLLNPPPHMSVHALRSTHGESFSRGANRGGFVWPPDEIQAFVKQELALFDRIRPDLVVADFRFSAAISAELAGLPLAVVANAHWSPYRNLGFSPLPPWSAATRLRQRLGQMFFPRQRTSASAAINEVRRRHGLGEVSGFLELVTRGTYTLYADSPDVVATVALPPNHRFIGPVFWSPNIPRPPWWSDLDRERPIVYVTLGSTGAANRLETIVRTLRQLPITIIVATAGRARLASEATNVFVADYLPGDAACQLASVVVCSGGSATAYQALSHGTPVAGAWSNIDQYLTLMSIANAGAGTCSHVDQDSGSTVRIVQDVLASPSYRQAARALAESFRAFDVTQRFPLFVDEVLERVAS